MCPDELTFFLTNHSTYLFELPPISSPHDLFQIFLARPVSFLSLSSVTICAKSLLLIPARTFSRKSFTEILVMSLYLRRFFSYWIEKYPADTLSCCQNFPFRLTGLDMGGFMGEVVVLAVWSRCLFAPASLPPPPPIDVKDLYLVLSSSERFFDSWSVSSLFIRGCWYNRKEKLIISLNEFLSTLSCTSYW